MTKHWFATAFLIASPVVATVPAAAQTALSGGNGAAIIPPTSQPEVVSATSTPGVTILAQVAQAPGAAAPGGAAVAPLPAQQAQAQPATPQVVPAPAAPAMPAPAAGPISVQALGIETGGGILLQLPRPVSTVIAADPRIARVQPVSPTSLFVIGVSQGRTTLIATNEAGLPIVQYEVTVRRAGSGETTVTTPAPAGAPPAPPSARDIRAGNASAAQAAIRQHVPGAGGVKVTAVEGNLVLSGTVATPQQALNVETVVKSFMGGQSGLINNLVVLSSMQVNVRVRVVEMSRSVARDLGINWKAIGQIGNFSFAYLSPQVTAGSTVSSMGRLASNLVGVGYQSGGWDVNAVVDALATDNLVSILAEPNLTAMSGEPASFLAGGEFPVSTQQSSGGGVVGGAAVFTTEYKQFGVGLAVVPTVLAPGRINMRIRPEVSDINTGITDRQGNPGISTRRAETTIELGSGQSFAIAGLLSNSVRDQLSTLPWLGEIPVLGALFRSQRFQRQETELVIIVTPYIVEPVSASAQMRTPADGFVPATDLNRLLYGRQMRGDSGRSPARPLDAGFILK